MLRRKNKIAKGQSGNATTTGLMILSGVAAATAAVLTVNQGLRKSRDLGDQTDLERRLNESALQTVTQLITNGALHFNEKCNRLEPTQEFDLTGKLVNENYVFPAADANGAESCGSIQAKRKAIDCGSEVANAQWLYENNAQEGREIVSVCVTSTEKKAGVLVSSKKIVKVSFEKYVNEEDDAKNLRRIALAKSQPQGRNLRGAFYSSLNGKISLGLKEGNAGLLGKHGAADSCFYMRPITSEQKRGKLSSKNLAFNARATNAKYTLSELEPRPDGPNSDEYGETHDLTTQAPEGYEVLAVYRNNLLDKKYKSNFRGNRPSSDNWNSNALAWTPPDVSASGGRSRYTAEILSVDKYHQVPGKPQPHFIGVMPNVPNGPQFQYFLAAKVGTSQHLHDRKTFNPAFFGEFKQGCVTSTGDSKATFCTRVDIPLKTYKATFNNKCTSKKQDLKAAKYNEARDVKYANRAVLTSCNKEWVDTVEKLLKEEESKLTGLQKPEDATTAAMAFSALEVDDDFIQKKGKWAGHPIRNAYDSFKSTIEKDGGKVVDDYTVEYVGDQDQVTITTETDADGNTTEKIEIVYKAKVISHDIPMIQELQGVAEEEKHEAKSCAYFKYYDPTNPKTCSISFVTKNDAGFVCRNNDGCFDELTKIRMADGSDRLVTQLRKGDFVYNPVTKMPAKITKLTIGPELKPLLHVTVGGSTVRVTDSHPFMTTRGWVAAKNLRSTDKILGRDGKYLGIQKVEIGASGHTVANLALEGPANQPELHYVLADGVVTGDLVIQNMLEQRAALTDEGRGK
ncbi:MAG: hypothetical protein RLZZ488_325 [Pseudomonadota bacterium]|jgi:hypothetical protein